MMPIVAAALLLAGPPDVGAVLAAVFARGAARDALITDACYRGDYRYREEDAAGRLLREETCERVVYVKGERQRVDFVSVTVNGRELEGRARDRQIAALEKKGLVVSRANMPFVPEARDAYDYELLGTDSCSGLAAWVVGFTPRRRSQEMVVGRALVDRETGDVVRMEFRPARLPWVCGETRMVLESAEMAGFWYPVRFEMEMKVRVRILVTLMSRTIRAEDRFSDYRFNTGLPDSVFK